MRREVTIGELARQRLAQRRRERMGGVREALLGDLFGAQRTFIEDPARAKAVLCPRRAGKTWAAARYLFLAALTAPGALARFWAITRERARDLMWRALKETNERYGLGAEFNESRLSVSLSNGSEIRLAGADKEKEAQKKRGDKSILEIVDEAPVFGAYLTKLLDDVIGPSLIDLRGTVCLMGTPGFTVPVGLTEKEMIAGHYWYAITRPEKDERAGGWSVHTWDVYDNPHIPGLAETLAEEKAARGWSDDHPTWLREYRGQWVNDSGALFYRFDATRNTYTERPNVEGWQYALGWDLGRRDAMALVLWGWHASLPHLYELESWKESETETSTVMAKVAEWDVARGGDVRWKEDGAGNKRPEWVRSAFRVRVADTGGGGAQTVADVASIYRLTFEPAKKPEKHLHAEMLNDDLTAGKILVRRSGPLAAEWGSLPKDQDDPTKEDPRFPNHCADAALYAWRKARHYRYAAPVEAERAPEGDAIKAAAVAAMKRKKQTPWFLGGNG